MTKRRAVSGAFLAIIGLICGSCSSTSQQATSGAITGQWSGTLTSAIRPGPNPFNVDFSQAGSGVFVNSGLMITRLPCDSPTVTATGQLSGSDLTLTANLDNATYDFTGTLSADGSTLSGTFQQTTNSGSNCPGGDHGTWSLQIVPNFTGNYSGPATTSDPYEASQAMMTASISQSSNFTVSVTLSVTNSTCFNSGSFSGPAVGNQFTATSSDQTITVTGNEPTNAGTTPPSSVSVGYNFNEPGQPCDGAYGSGDLKRTGP